MVRIVRIEFRIDSVWYYFRNPRYMFTEYVYDRLHNPYYVIDIYLFLRHHFKGKTSTVSNSNNRHSKSQSNKRSSNSNKRLLYVLIIITQPSFLMYS